MYIRIPKIYINMTLNDIRKRSGLLIIVIGIAMLGFILTDLMSSGTSLFQKGQNMLLKIDNQEVTFTSFEKELENNINIKFSSGFGGVNITEAQRKNERDLLWDQIVEDILLEEKFNQSGVSVGNTEIWDLISGEITGNQTQLFGLFFRDQSEAGEWIQYTPDLIRDWIEMGTDNPQWPRYLFFKENEIRERQISKYSNAIKKGLFATHQDANYYYSEQTKSISGDYLYIPCNSDVAYNPSAKEINQYYKKNKRNYMNNPNREITYFMFDLVASEVDKDNILKEMSELILDKRIFNKRINQEEVDLGFMNTQNLENFINQYGDNNYTETILSKQDFNAAEFTISDNIIEPYIEKGFCRMGRIVNSQLDSITIVYLDRELYASDQTLNEIYSQVFDFINNNKKITDPIAIGKKIGINPRQVPLEKMDDIVPGLGASRQIVRWAFDEETILNETKFFDLQDKYIVAFVSNISESEFQPLQEVKNQIITDLRKSHTNQQVVEQIKTLNFNSLDELAEEFNVSVETISQLRMRSESLGDAEYNPGSVGAFFGCQKGMISEPFISKEGVFVFHKKTDNPISYPTDISRYKQLVENTYQSQVDLLLVDMLKSDKQLVDNRFNFY